MPTPLTIALCNETDGPGGAEVLLVQLAAELRDRGHRVIPVLPTPAVGWIQERFREHGFESEAVQLLGSSMASCVSQLRSIFRRHEVGVVHSHEFTMAVFGAAAARSLGLRHVITMHGNQWMTDSWKRRTALRVAFRMTHEVTAVSGDTRDHLVETLGRPAERVRVIVNGVPVRQGDGDAVREEFSLAPETLLLLAVGGLHPRKGHDVLLRALSGADGEKPWKLIIAGQGPERARLQELAESEGIAERVLLVGQREDIPDLQAAADLFVMPSLWEGLPLAMLEAMLAATPVVASRISGIPEAIRDGEEGLLVPPGDVSALREALSRMMADDDLRRRLGAAGEERALRDFTIRRMAEDYERLYTGVAAEV